METMEKRVLPSTGLKNALGKHKGHLMGFSGFPHLWISITVHGNAHPLSIRFLMGCFLQKNRTNILSTCHE